MLTLNDITKLTGYAPLSVLTPEQAKYIQRCIPQNSWLDAHKIRWWFPVNLDGYPLEGAQCYDHPIRAIKVLSPKAIRQPNPASIASRMPWLDEGIHRTTWFARQAKAGHVTSLLSLLPAWVPEAEGLKLYSSLAAVAACHKLDIKGLWERVGEVLRELAP